MIVKYTISIGLLFLFSLASFGQTSFEIFSIELASGKVDLTQNVDERFLGQYAQENGDAEWHYQLRLEKEAPIYLKKTSNKDNLFTWEAQNTRISTWGFLVKDGALAVADLSEFEDGKLKSYSSYILLYQLEGSDEIVYENIYEKDGQLYLGMAERVDDVAESQ